MNQVLATISCVIALSACNQEAPAPTLTPVRVTAVETLAGSEGLTYSAQIEAQSSVDLSFRSNGYVVEITERPGLADSQRLLQTGDTVEQGEILARIDDREYQDKVQTAQANLEKALAAAHKGEQDYGRATALQKSASITAPDFDSAEEEYQTTRAAVVAAKAQLDEAQLKLKNCAIYAPQSGTLMQRNIEIGSLVHANSVAFELAQIDTVDAIFGLPDVILPGVSVGSELELTSMSFGQRVFRGAVTRIAEGADSRSHLFEVAVTVDNADRSLRPGMVASITLSPETTASLVAIPMRAIVEGDDGSFAVFIATEMGDDTVAVRRNIKVGQVLGNRVVVTSGLRAGEQLIVTGAALVRDQQPVRLTP